MPRGRDHATSASSTLMRVPVSTLRSTEGAGSKATPTESSTARLICSTLSNSWMTRGVTRFSFSHWSSLRRTPQLDRNTRNRVITLQPEDSADGQNRRLFARVDGSQLDNAPMLIACAIRVLMPHVAPLATSALMAERMASQLHAHVCTSQERHYAAMQQRARAFLASK